VSVLACPIVSSVVDLQVHSGTEEQGLHASQAAAHHSGPTAAVEKFNAVGEKSIVFGQPCHTEIANYCSRVLMWESCAAFNSATRKESPTKGWCLP
jgi:hypothetical protein